MRLRRHFQISFVLLASVLVTACSPLFFWPDSVLRQTPSAYGFSYDEVIVISSDERLYGWHVRPEATNDETPPGLIYYLYGNAQNMSAHFRSVAWLVAQGWEVFTLDYRGYGRSTGEPDVPGIHRDAYVGLQWATYEARERDLPLVILGQSLGASAAITMLAQAEEPAIDALILDSPFAGYRRMVREKMRLNWFTRFFAQPASLTVPDRYSPIRHMSGVPEIPILMLHGCGDRVIPCEHSDALVDVADHHITFWKDPEADHTEMLLSPEWRDKVLGWLESNVYADIGS